MQTKIWIDTHNKRIKNSKEMKANNNQLETEITNILGTWENYRQI